MATNRPGKKTLDTIEGEVITAGISFYRKFRQELANGVLPIGISGVGKTTLLSQLDASGPTLFSEFNRTLKTRIKTERLRQDLIKACEKTRYVRKIDVPGEIPEEWACAYFDNNPKILVVMVDGREAEEQIAAFEQFVALVREGPSFWQKTKTVIALRWNNLVRIFFVINKIDLLDAKSINIINSRYRALLAEMNSIFGVNIQTFKISLTEGDGERKNKTNEQNELFLAIIDALEG
jgi:GTPase SAR1 family protein